MGVSDEEIERRMGYHPATAETGPMYETNRELFMHVARHVVAATPEGREQSLALTALQESMMWTNAAIACDVHRCPVDGIKGNHEHYVDDDGKTRGRPFPDQ